MKKYLLTALLCLIIIMSGCYSSVPNTPNDSAIQTILSATYNPDYLELKDKQISQIYVYTYNVGFIDNEYKIDLGNQMLYQFNTEPVITRNSSATNEGYQKVSTLDKKKIDVFIREAKKYRMVEWNEMYYNDHIYDVYDCGIQITFTDGTKKDTYCSCLFPDTWNNMCDAFKALTGTYIIQKIDPKEFQ